MFPNASSVVALRWIMWVTGMDYTRFEIGISEKRTAWLVAFVDKQEADFFSSGFGRLSSVARSLHHAKQEYKYREKVKASVIAVREIQVATRTTDKASVGTKCTSPGQIFFSGVRPI